MTYLDHTTFTKGKFYFDLMMSKDWEPFISFSPYWESDWHRWAHLALIQVASYLTMRRLLEHLSL